MSDGMMLFFGMVFVAVALLSQGLIVPVFSESRKMRKKLQERLSEIEAESGEESFSSLLREKYLRKLSPGERYLEDLSPMKRLGESINFKLSNLIIKIILTIQVTFLYHIKVNKN